MRSLACCAALSLPLVLGCAPLPTTAVVQGVTVPRLTLEYAGQPYLVRHTAAHPQPGGPSSGLRDHGGKITGQVCGMDIDYQVQHLGDHVQLVGFLDMRLQSQIQVRDHGGERLITGSLHHAVVDLHLRSNELVGTSGYRHFHLIQQGNRLVGQMAAINTDTLTEVIIEGRDELWALPAAVQAAVLPSLLTCFVAKIGAYGRSPLRVGFGGRPGAQPRESSSIYQL
ncbi:MAG: hypothetical protein RMK29_15825 [Myxococcales bacterium]|nr:hypothetical protein [Myxococcota bacterium]MDW8283185.1 hypothetical protein [Myxococcales bacterium]